MSNPRKPTKIKIIQHTFRRDRGPRHEPEPDPLLVVPKPPSHLSPAAKRFWKAAAVHLVSCGILTVLDLAALEITAVEYGMWRELYGEIRCWVTVTTPDGRVRRRRRTIAEYLEGKTSHSAPVVQLMRDCWRQFRYYASEFGLTPSSRGRLDIVPAPGTDDDTIAKMMRGER